MPTHLSEAGVRVDAPDGVTVTFGAGRVDRRLGPIFAAGPVPYSDERDLEPVMAEALAGQGMVALPPITIDAPRGALAARAVSADATATVRVTLGADEGAVALAEQGEVYSWLLPETLDGPADASTRSGPAGGEVEFMLPLGTRVEVDPSRRSLFTSPLLAPVRVLVFRFAARRIVGAAVRYQESALFVGPVVIEGSDPSEWRAGTSVTIGPPKDGARHRVLLLVHGTFSSTAGAFAQLAPTPWGSEFLAACIEHYDLVLGYDHRTLSVDPAENATDVVAHLRSLPWGPEPPVVDVIAHSRGGLVARSIIEEAAPTAGWNATFGSVILVGATNAGTELASPDNWRTFLDLYTNLTLAACRALTFLPHAAPVATVLKEAVSLIGEFVKQIPAAGLDVALAPGLGAMVPGSAAIQRLAGSRAGEGAAQQGYHVISSSFSPRLRAGDDQPREFPTRLLHVLAEANVSTLMRGAENDLVVDLTSMSDVRAAGVDVVRDALHFASSPHIYHTNYMSRPEVVAAFRRWLRLPPSARSAAEGPVRRGSTTPSSLSPGSSSLEEPPAAVDSNVLVLDAEEASGTVLSSARLVSPAFVVLERRVGDANVRSAFSLAELVAALWDHGARSAADALGLRAWAGDPVASVEEVASQAVGGGRLFRTGRSAEGNRLERTVVTRDEAVAGVLPNAVEVVIDADIGAIAADMLSRGGAGHLRRAIPPPIGMAHPATTSSESVRGAAAGGGSPSSAPLSCEILAETPRRVALGRTLTVRVTISTDDTSASLGLSDRAQVAVDPSRDIAVEVWPKRGFTFAEDDESAIVRPPTPGSPSLASFRMLAVDIGRGELWVIARQGKVPLATLKLSPEVTEGVASVTADIELQAGRTVRQVQGRSPPHVLTILEQDRGSGGTVFRFELDSPSIGKLNRYWSDPIVGDRNGYVEGLYASIEGRWTGSAAQSAEFEEELRDFGGSLWEQLLPEPLRRDLWEARDLLDSIFVLSEEPFIPWELLYMTEPRRPRSTGGRFLAELGLVRWLYEAEAAPPIRLVVGRGRARFAIPDYPVVKRINLAPLPEAVAERDFLRDRFGASPVEPSLKAVSDLLAGPGGFDLLHFAGHGAAARAAFDEARVMLAGEHTPEGYVAEYLSADRVAGRADFGGTRPLIVLNACQAGRASRRLTGLGGFARAFLSRRAGLFLGTLWSVGDAPARHFTEAFYDALIAGQGVAAASRVGRATAKSTGDATWLAYAIYAHPEATLERRGFPSAVEVARSVDGPTSPSAGG